MMRRDPLTYRHPRTMREAWPQDGPQTLDRPSGWGKAWVMIGRAVVIVNWAAFVGFWLVWAAREFTE